MNKYPKFAEIKGKRYKINTDYRVALKCNGIINDKSISDEERSLAIIYLLFSDEGLNNINDWERLLKVAVKFLSCNNNGNENNYNKKEEVNMDYQQDWSYIRTSFFSEYNIDLDTVEMHWWRFYELLCGMSEKCIFNRVMFIRDFDISQIKDSVEKEKWIRQKKAVALKQKETEKTAEEKRLDDLFEQQLRGGGNIE